MNCWPKSKLANLRRYGYARPHPSPQLTPVSAADNSAQSPATRTLDQSMITSDIVYHYLKCVKLPEAPARSSAQRMGNRHSRLVAVPGHHTHNSNASGIPRDLANKKSRTLTATGPHQKNERQRHQRQLPPPPPIADSAIHTCVNNSSRYRSKP